MYKRISSFFAIICLVLVLALTGCGQKYSPPLNQGTQEPTPSVAPDSKTGNQPEESEQPPEPSDTPEPSPSPVAKAYHMNKNYDIVPNDPAVSKKVVLLTFDDGPKEQEMLEKIISTLEKHDAKAIFFMNGYRIEQNPDLLKMIYERGQVLGNHSWDHIDLKKESAEKIDQQIGDVQEIVKEITGETPMFFRPPYGSGGDVVTETAKKHGLLSMNWSNGSLDWEMSNNNNDPQKVVDNVLEQLHYGSNILMHELPWTAEALDQLLTKLKDQGYKFVDPHAIELEMR